MRWRFFMLGLELVVATIHLVAAILILLAAIN
jgi:hypothetical protein